MNDIKKHWQDVQKVKRKIYYDEKNKDLSKIQKELVRSLENLQKHDFILKGIIL